MRRSLEAQTPLLTAAILGVITGVFGGVLGDVICNEIPSLFRPSPLYATCSFAGSWAYLLLYAVAECPETPALAAGRTPLKTAGRLSMIGLSS